MICLRTTDDWFEAHILRGLFEADGLHAVVLCEHLVRLDWTQSLAYGGYRVCVPLSQAPAAKELLDAWQRGELADASERCTICGGTRFVPHRSNGRRLAFAFLLIGLPVPVPFGADHKACIDCGTAFRESAG
jgi:hypothetical protein